MLKVLRMSADKSLRRLSNLHGLWVGQGKSPRSLQIEPCRCCSNTVKDPGQVSIGDVSVAVKPPQHPEYVPHKYLKKKASQSTLRHLRWIMQKDQLGQDVFLIGPPGPVRRQLAMMYLELTKREGEYVSLSRDTTEADLKQRREIKAGTAFYLDQAAVRAAVEGRVLVLEGIEKAERNVLPVLNNLLENREMQLEDGRFLVAPDRYDKLLKDHTREELEDLKLVRVDERFRVIALGLPVPRYQGNPLDPPLRSRFQARDINPLPYHEQLELLQECAPNVNVDKLNQVLMFATTLLTAESTTLGLPDFPVANLPELAKILNVMPNTDVHSLLQRLYPYMAMLGKEGQTAVTDALQKFNVPLAKTTEGQLESVDRQTNNAQVHVTLGNRATDFEVSKGTLDGSGHQDHAFITTPYHNTFLTDMLQSHMVKDFCVIGPRGCGKSALVRQFASLLGYHSEVVMLYQDMTSRDLLQQRTTSPSGDTAWRLSPLVTAALEGSLAVLDGVHRINPGSFSVLQRLVHDRELQLFDGSRLLGKERYEAVKAENNLTDAEMEERGILRIHPSFRILALGEPPVTGSSTGQWLSPEMLSLFLYHNMRPLTHNEEEAVISQLVKDCPDLTKLLTFTHRLRNSTDPTISSIAASLSSRQLIRVARRLANFPTEDLYSIVQKACLARFLPRLAKTALEQSLEDLSITPPAQPTQSIDNIEKSITCEVKDNKVRIGTTVADVYDPDNKTKVPDVLFYENTQHLCVMEDMLKDFLLGEHLLLVGNQGVGKNKIVDRFLHLLNRPREYIQLHRDTTVQTLTLQPTVQDGVIIYEDSPLVRAVKMGHVLVVDEADKAPTHVTCILKTLVESGEMHLADGRRIVAADSGLAVSDKIIVSHPDFRMIVLANRPGFPFLGNDFFGAMGDIFSCHGIDNPDKASEMAMLRQYGPDVSEQVLEKLVLSFGELRNMADQGLIAYPYSTREVVNMVKHIQRFPDEGLTTVIGNVFDFDSYNSELREVLISTMQKHGIPLGARPDSIQLAKELPLPRLELTGQWTIQGDGGRRRTSLLKLPTETYRIGVKGPVSLRVETETLERTEARADKFSEQEAYWQVPLHESNIISDLAVSLAANRSPGHQTDVIHIGTANPVGLYSMSTRAKSANHLDMYDIFPMVTGSYRPHVRLMPLAAPLDDTVVLHEEVTNTILAVNYENGEINRLVTPSLPQTAPERRRFTSPNTTKTSPYRMVKSDVPDEYGTVVFFEKNGDFLEVLGLLEGISQHLPLPLKVANVTQVGSQTWMLSEDKTNKKFLVSRSGVADFTLQAIMEDNVQSVLGSSAVPMSDATLSASLGEQTSGSNRVLSTPESYASIALGFPEAGTSRVYSSRRPAGEGGNTDQDSLLGRVTGKSGAPSPSPSSVYLPGCAQLVRTLPNWKAPEGILSKDQRAHTSGLLEVADLPNQKLRYVPVPGATRQSPYASWLFNLHESSVLVSRRSADGLVTVDVGGCVRLWETGLENLQRALNEWRRMIGLHDDKPLQVTYEKESERTADGPKHGKEDKNNDPHVGGNTWAGGTGGSNTAGLGGFGGPYRLDAGHDVTQVPQWQKDSVPEHVRQAAREMGQKAFKERLREIQMSEYDAETYETFSKHVRRQVQALRVVIDSLQAKSKERQWLKNQPHGDLDDAKLIDGLTGERNVYKRRGEKEPEMGGQQEHPKLLRLLVDCSGSMYRFNGHDGRLEREMEASIMAMEALEGHEEKIKFDIWGHSGEDHRVALSTFDKPPHNNKERLQVVKTMHAHSQFCLSGDTTLQATKHAIEMLAKEDADERFLIVLSDANFDRYGIPPSRFGEILRSHDEVNAFAIFIGSLGDQATRLTKQLPMGHSFVCLDTKNLPQILQQIFTSTMLAK
ncbi:von Willebrand factor A domain-containing protein 8-like [Mya arenaria]|uniref:von Willebrand factor A domain-containing protein 8-like n=1 Tax=Mya arenaria TaxID=6604 RepID=UPI0022E12FC9|nr:von Willebrand factor A domain-containing protein 8-like [Mya arenaria]